MGEGLARALARRKELPGAEASILLAAERHDVPVTVHAAIGAEIIHQHPAADGAAIGATSHLDFRRLAASIPDLHQGGVVLNCGSAVLMRGMADLAPLARAKKLGELSMLDVPFESLTPLKSIDSPWQVFLSFDPRLAPAMTSRKAEETREATLWPCWPASPDSRLKSVKRKSSRCSA